MAKYEETIKKIKESSGSSAFSRAAEEQLANALLNDVDYCQKQYVKKGDSFEVKESYPVKEFRDGLKQRVKSEFGVDAAEAEKLTNCNIGKAVSTPVADLGATVIKGVMKTGKSFVFNPESETETKMVIGLREMPEKVIETTKLEKQGDKFVTVPTGDKVKYTKRTEITATNKHLSTTKFKLR